MRSARSRMNDHVETRSVRESLSETIAMTLMLLLLAGVPMYLAANSAGAAGSWNAVANAGSLLYEQAGWALNTYIAVLLGFYVVSIGGQLLGGPKAALRTRRILGFVGELMAAATVVLFFFLLVAYCAREPDKWASMIVFVPMVAIIAFLGLRLGSFVVFERSLRIAAAEKTRASTEELIEKLGAYSSRSFWLVWVVTSAAVAIVALLVSLPLLKPGSTVWAFGLFLLLELSLTGVIAWTHRLRLIDRGFFSRVVVWSLPFLCFVLVGLGPLSLYLRVGSSPSLLRLGAAFLVLTGGAALVSFWPRREKPSWILNWSINGVSAKRALRTLKKRLAHTEKQLAALAVEPDVPRALFWRVVEAVRSSSANDSSA
jgi:hypothetical protein